MMIWGNLVGLLFAIVVLATAVISIPLLLDRDVGAWVAVETSVRAALTNPLTIAAWGLIVAALLVIGSLPFFIGLAVVMPVLGHATWHLYRKLVISDLPPIEVHPTPSKGRRYAADFPACLFPVYGKDKGP